MKKVRDEGLITGIRDLLLAAVSSALVCGAVEAAVEGFQVVFTRRLMFVSEDVAWMSPLAYLVFFLVIAAPPAVLSLLLRRRIPLSWSVGAFGALVVFSWLLPFQQIYRLAALALALGVGSRLGWLASRAAEPWRRALRRVAVITATLTAITGVGVRVWRRLTERRTVASLPTAIRGRPNVLFVVFDTVRRANLGLYGYTRPVSPRLDALAKEGVTFDNAIATAPWTLPSHGSLFTGLPAESAGGDWRRRTFPGPPALAEAFAAEGYLTGAFVANLGYTGYDSGLARGFAHVDDYPLSLYLVLLHSSIGRTRMFSAFMDAGSWRARARSLLGFDLSPQRNPSSYYRSADRVTDAFLAWHARASSHPFFAFINLFDAHQPYHAPDEYFASFHGLPANREDRYDAAIAFMDHELGRMVDSLARRGVLEHTLIVVVADHGEQFGEHGLRGHANSLYLPLLEVPLIFHYPGTTPPGRRIAPPVTLRDVAATVLDLAGIGNSAHISGSSLTRYWREDSPPRSDIVAYLSKGINVGKSQRNWNDAMASRLDDSLHYIKASRSEELYAWRTDRAELTNLAADPAWRPALERLRRGLP